jgi:hypothetical protein
LNSISIFEEEGGWKVRGKEKMLGECKLRWTKKQHLNTSPKAHFLVFLRPSVRKRY